MKRALKPPSNDHFATLTRTALRSNPPHSRRVVPPPLYGAGALLPTSSPERRGAPGPRAGSRETPPGLQIPESPEKGDFPENSPKRGSPGLPGSGPQKPPKYGYRAPPRGVDVKDPSKIRRDPAKRAQNRQKARKRAFLAILGIFAQFWRFSGFRGLFRPLGDPRDPSGGVAFTSTPRGGALWPLPEGSGAASAVQARGSPRIGALGVSPRGSVAEHPLGRSALADSPVKCN